LKNEAFFFVENEGIRAEQPAGLLARLAWLAIPKL